MAGKTPTYNPANNGTFPVAISSGRIANAAAVVQGTIFVSPYAGVIRDYHVNIDTQFTHASAALAMGLFSDSDSHLNDYDLTNSFTGYRNLIGDALWITKAVTHGGLYVSAELANTDTTGKLTVTLVLAPN